VFASSGQFQDSERRRKEGMKSAGSGPLNVSQVLNTENLEFYGKMTRLEGIAGRVKK